MYSQAPKKHLVFSTAYDPSTDQVLDWMAAMGGQFIRKNTNDQYIEREDTVLPVSAQAEDRRYASIWFRKISGLPRQDWLSGVHLSEAAEAFQANLPYFNQYVERERKTFYDFYYQSFQAGRILSPYEAIRLNKLVVLNLAASIGLDVPKTLITKRRKILERFRAECPEGVINKSISEHLFFDGPAPDIKRYANYTEEITDGMIRTMPETFDLSLFQEKLDKDFEIRTFYLEGRCHSMAIFSQDNERTSLDFRRYDKSNPNRLANFSLPGAHEALIARLMGLLGLNTGSLDLIQTRNGRMAFLEVNPAGQFGMVSVPCNYGLEKQIASYLINGNES